MSLPVVASVSPGSAAAIAGIAPGDEIVSMNGQSVRDVIQYRLLADEPEVDLVVRRGGLEREFTVEKPAGAPIGLEVSSALFDQLRTCDNHCSFCFIYQLPPGMRESLYLKDDDYRLSFLYGNFTTLTRFTEADLERVVTERLSPLNVSIHATDPDVRARLLRNRRGATSLRWLRALLDHGIEVHGQLVICPGLNDGDVLEDTLCGIADRYPELASVHAVPLGLSRFNTESELRVHTAQEAAAVVDTVQRWQEVFLDLVGHPMVYAADEYYLVAGRPFPEPEVYGDVVQHENGVGMVATLARELRGEVSEGVGVASGFFAWVEGAPGDGYRAPREAKRIPAHDSAGHRGAGEVPGDDAPVAILTGGYGAQVFAGLLPPVLAELGRAHDVRVVEVINEYFGGNTAVAGLMVGADIERTLAGQPGGHRYLLPDVCLSRGQFLDGMRPEELCRPVEVVATDGVSLRAALTRRAA